MLLYAEEAQGSKGFDPQLDGFGRSSGEEKKSGEKSDKRESGRVEASPVEAIPGKGWVEDTCLVVIDERPG